MKPKIKRRLLILLGITALLALAILLFASGGYRADERALGALFSDTVRVERTDFGWLFDGPSDAAALIFYPGGRVEETAYAPLLRALAEKELDVFLVKMPLGLAVLDGGAADKIMARWDYARWYIGGHSLGGAVAANYAAAHDLDGVILLAAYPTKAVDEPMLLVYGSEDGVLNRSRLAAAPQYGATEEVRLEGGNHARFGDYGEQKGDGAAALSPEEQQRATVEAVAAWLARQERAG